MKYQCPSCDHEVTVGTPCPVCSRKEKPTKNSPKSWQQDESYDGLDLGDDDFDYDDFVKREFGSSAPHEIGIKWYWYVVAILVLLAILWETFF